MHAIRPRSAKGRTRPKVTHVHNVDDERVHQKAAFSPKPPPCPRPPSTASHRFDLSLRPRSVLRCSSTPSSDVLTEKVPVPSLNRYIVLPSIQKKADSARYIEEKTSRLSLSDISIHSQRVSRLCPNPASRRGPEMGRASRKCASATMPSGCEENETDLLLAIRSPSGQRFQCQFHPTDTLQAVVAAAEAKFGARYENTLIETMEVPRRSFTNLTATLAQCGIFTKSVLCISLADSATDSCGEEDVR